MNLIHILNEEMFPRYYMVQFPNSHNNVYTDCEYDVDIFITIYGSVTTFTFIHFCVLKVKHKPHWL